MYWFFSVNFTMIAKIELMGHELATNTLRDFQVASGKKKILLPMQEMQEMQIQSLCWEDPLEQEMSTHSSILAWKISWTEELSAGQQSMGLQRVGHIQGLELYSCISKLYGISIPAEMMPVA